jgi:hypothetical protein
VKSALVELWPVQAPLQVAQRTRPLSRYLRSFLRLRYLEFSSRTAIARSWRPGSSTAGTGCSMTSLPPFVLTLWTPEYADWRTMLESVMTDQSLAPGRFLPLP